MNLGYEPTHIRRLKPKHFYALGGFWERAGRCPGTIQNRISELTQMCARIRKPDCAEITAADVVSEPSRSRVQTVAHREKTFTAHGVDVVELLTRMAEKYPRIALIQWLKAAFGLRTKEAIMLRPHEDCQGDHLRVTRGTKGGRPRTVSYFDAEGDLDPKTREIVLWNLRENRLRVEVIEMAKYLVPPGHSMIPRDYTLARFRRRERYVTELFGMTKRKLGVTPHGFRHEVLSARAEQVSGLIRPMRRAIG